MIETERIREEYGYSIKCAQCGTWFECVRVTGTYCSSTCRSRAVREPAQRALRIKKANSAIYGLVRALPKRGDSDEFVALQKLATLIKNALDLVES